MFCSFKKKLYLCIAIEKNNGSIAQLNRAFDYGSKGYRFESYWSHSKQETNKTVRLFYFIHPPVWLFRRRNNNTVVYLNLFYAASV